MKICIKSPQGKTMNIYVPMPLALIFIKRRFVRVIKKQCKDAAAGSADDLGYPSGGIFTKEDAKKLKNGLKAAKKQWGHLKIVEVFSVDGEEVTITL